eukprot:jgi/Tetstr1/436053/TSEL_024931.t1
MTELVRLWDDARTEAFYAGHARQRRTDADLFSALLLVGTADTVVALVEDGELSRAAGRLSSKARGGGALTHAQRLSPMLGFVAHVPKKLGEDWPPNVRHMAVGEAERRAVAERAVVENMKEAYVSLGARAVIVHTDLCNAYNEAWRRTIIQRHIDCSPLHPAIPVLLASLSTDSFLLVDDRSAPMRSEDGVQQGRPLATTSFFVAIFPEVHECDSTLVTYAAARFNADDGYFVGLPAHVWPALHAFRTSITASVGLEVRFN